VKIGIAKSIAAIKEGVRKTPRTRMEAFSRWKPTNDLEQLFFFSVALKGMATAVSDAANRPRAETVARTLSDWSDALDGLSEGLVDRAKKIKPRNLYEAEKKAEILLDWEIRRGSADPLRTLGVAQAIMREYASVTRKHSQP
jgi:hypothetical protein